MKPATHALYAV